MASKCERIFYSHNILCVLMVFISKSLQNFDFNFTLFMQFFPIFQYLQSNYFLALMIKASYNNSKGSLSKFLLDFISIIYLFFSFIKIISLVVIKTMIVNSVLVSIRVRIFILTIDFTFDELTETFVFGI